MKASSYGRKVLQVVMMTALAVFVFGAAVQAADWKPTKPINFVVPYAPGGGSDVYARAIENVIKTAKLSSDRFLIENKAGGGGAIATTSVAQSPGNDHMLLTSFRVRSVVR